MSFLLTTVLLVQLIVNITNMNKPSKPFPDIILVIKRLENPNVIDVIQLKERFQKQVRLIVIYDFKINAVVIIHDLFPF